MRAQKFLMTTTIIMTVLLVNRCQDTDEGSLIMNASPRAAQTAKRLQRHADIPTSSHSKSTTQTLASLTNQPKNRYIVQFAKGLMNSATILNTGGTIARNLAVHDAVAVYLPDQAVETLEQHPHIKWVEADVKRSPLAESIPYGIPMIQAQDIIESATASKKVCIIDSGYFLDHEDLQNTGVTASPDAGTGDPFLDRCGHGTHVAGTIAALGNNGVGVFGINRNASISLHIVKVFADNCEWTYASDLVAAADQCREAGANVINMSLGGNRASRLERAAFSQLYYDHNIISVAAAGNSGNTRASYPAAYHEVIAVAAVGPNQQVADFSQKYEQVELAAPGVGILSTVSYQISNDLQVGNLTISGHHIDYSAYGENLEGPLVDGGLCTSAGPWQGSIVLCERGQVSFVEKVSHAEASGAKAVVIFNNVAGPLYATLDEDNPSTLVAISISQSDGLEIVNSGQFGQSSSLTAVNRIDASGYDKYDGTSMATSHISGSAALVWGEFPDATAQQVRTALQSTALDLPPAGRDTASGFGLVQSKAALDFLNAGQSCQPTETKENSCSDLIDNDCDGLVDQFDPDCQVNSCQLGQKGDSCRNGRDCCSKKCKGRRKNKTCQ